LGRTACRRATCRAAASPVPGRTRKAALVVSRGGPWRARKAALVVTPRRAVAGAESGGGGDSRRAVAGAGKGGFWGGAASAALGGAARRAGAGAESGVGGESRRAVAGAAKSAFSVAQRAARGHRFRTSRTESAARCATENALFAARLCQRVVAWECVASTV